MGGIKSRKKLGESKKLDRFSRFYVCGVGSLQELGTTASRIQGLGGGVRDNFHRTEQLRHSDSFIICVANIR